MGKSISEVLTALTLCGANYRADSCKACPLNDSCKPGDNAALVDAATEAITDLVAFNALCLQEKAGLLQVLKHARVTVYKIFGLVAEHMKGLPEVGQAFKVKKKETNTVIFDMVENFPKHNPDERIIATHRTRLMYESMEVWQEERNNSCMLVPSETAGMLLDHGRIVQWIDGGLLITGRASRIFVRHCRYRADDPQQDAINFLSGKRWW